MEDIDIGPNGWLWIFEFSAPVDLLRIAAVCTKFHQVILNNLLVEAFWWPKFEGWGCRFGSDGWVKILEFLSPRDLLRVSTVSSSFRRVISENQRIVIQSGMLQGGKSMRSIVNLRELMNLKAIFVPDSLRILRLINGRTCEVCFHNRCNFVRPQNGMFVCWECLRNPYPNSLGLQEEYAGLSGRWHKVVYLPNRGYFVKQFYQCNRYVCFDIFNHKRVLVHPTGTRYLCSSEGSGFITTTTRDLDKNIVSKDAHEICWLRHIRDLCGNLVGPIFLKRHISPLVEYINRLEQNYDLSGTRYIGRRVLVESFLKSEIPTFPPLSAYKPFDDAFDTAKVLAHQKELKKRM